MHEPDGDIRSHPLTMTKLHHEHREGFDIPGILQGTCVHWLETGITDQFGNFVFRAGIVAAIEDCRHVVAEQMCSRMENAREDRVERFNDGGVRCKFRDFFWGGSRQPYLEAAGAKWIYTTDKYLPVQRSGVGKGVANCGPRDREEHNITVANRTLGRAGSSMRSNSSHKVLQLLGRSRAAEHDVVAVLCPEPPQAGSHLSRTDDSDFHIWECCRKYRTGAVQLCTTSCLWYAHFCLSVDHPTYHR